MMSRVARKRLVGPRRISISVLCPAPYHAHMSSSLTEVHPWPTAYMREQHRFWRDCADAQARLNLCYSQIL